ncbi:MAG: PDZ domain-containing protein, partial [Bacillota bacterium]
MIESASVNQVPADQLWEAAARGMIGALDDPYGQYLDVKSFEQLESSIAGSYEGIGVTIEALQGRVLIVNVFPQGPAARVGLHGADVLVEADGKPLKGMAPEAVAGLLRGPAGTPVRLLVMREGWDEPREIVVVREKIVIPSVESRMLGDG